VLDPQAPSSQTAIAEYRKPSVANAILSHACWLMGSAKDAEDLVHDALLCVLDPADSPWDPARAPLVVHMSIVMRDLRHNERRRARKRREVDSAAGDEEGMVDSRPGQDVRLGQEEEMAELRRLGTELRAALAEEDDPIAQTAVRVFDLAAEGIEAPREQAARIGCEPRQVYEANRRLKYHAQAILKRDRARRQKGLKP
jgi:DNA-directed RNA polymerase specialized sigma24 family protein